MKKQHHSGSNNIGEEIPETNEQKESPTPFLDGAKDARAYSVPVEVWPTRKIRKRMDELIRADHMETAVQTLEDSMRATRKFYNPISKTYEEEPDYKTRLDAAKTVIAYGDGMPVQRSITVSDSFESLRDALNAAAGQSDLARMALSQSFGLKPVNSLQDAEGKEDKQND